MLTGRMILAASLLIALAHVPAWAVLDVENQGPTLRAGRFEMRITNVGVIGNPYFYAGRSYDPSSEFPRGSGQELLNSAALWVGAVDETGEPHVSGGTLLEWRPTLAPDDTELEAWHGHPGMRQGEDDDGDGPPYADPAAPALAFSVPSGPRRLTIQSSALASHVEATLRGFQVDGYILRCCCSTVYSMSGSSEAVMWVSYYRLPTATRSAMTEAR